LKKLSWFLSVLFFVTLLAGCGSDPIQDDLISYINEGVLSVADEEKRILAEYASLNAENADDETFSNRLNESIIPAYQNYVEKVTDIKPKTKEVRALHEILIEIVNTQMSAFVTMVDALEKQNFSLVEQANGQLDQVSKLTKDYHEKLADLAKDYKVNYKNKDANS